MIFLKIISNIALCLSIFAAIFSVVHTQRASLSPYGKLVSISYLTTITAAMGYCLYVLWR